VTEPAAAPPPEEDIRPFWITDTAVKLRISMMVLMVLCTLAGIGAYIGLPKESSPSIEIPMIIVTTIYPGASPDDIESLITRPIEQELQGLADIEEIRSTSTEGVSSVVVEFSPDVDLSEANRRVREKVDLARTDLPADVEEPIISEIDFSEFPILNVNLAAAYPLAQLKEVAEDLKDELEAIPSVLEVILVGGVEREVQVDVNLAALQGYSLAFQDLIDAIVKENSNIPGGSVDVDHLNYLVRVNGQFQDPAEIRDLVVKTKNGEPIYVRDLAGVQFGFKERASYSRLRVLQKAGPDGKLVPVAAQPGDEAYQKVITLSVKKRSGENILDTSKAVDEVLARHIMPAGTQVLITGDQSEQVRDMVKDLENNIIAGLVFVVAVLLFFLGVRPAVLVGVAIPLSMLVTFIVFQAMGQTLNFIILFSLIIALGMLVDNAIVLVENIYRFMEQGHRPFAAARLGAREVAIPVITSTLTTVVAFIPMLFWPGITGEFMSFMPLTLIITLTCSLFVALVMNPVLTGYFGKPKPGKTRLALNIALWLTLALGLAVLGFVSRNALIVVGGGGFALWALHMLVMRHIMKWFMQRALPAGVEAYRRFLDLMLERNYAVRLPYLRNMFALGSFALGCILGALGGVLFAIAGMPAALLLLGPAAVLAGLGLAGIVLHLLEVIFTGRLSSIKLGVVLGVLAMGALGGLQLVGRPADEKLIAQLLGAPVLLVGLGLLGLLILRRPRHLILTDNRARLLNSVMGGLFGIIALYVVAPTGVEFFPTVDPSQVQISLKAAIGTHLDASNDLATIAQHRVDALLEKNPDSRANVKNVLVSVGVGGDMQFGGGQASPDISTLTLNLARYEHRVESSALTLKKLREQMEGIAGAEIEIIQDQAGPPTGPSVNIEVSGPEFSEIIRISESIKTALRTAADSTIPGLVDIRDNMGSGRPEMQVRIDRERAAQFGLDTRLIAQSIRAAINGAEAGKWRDGKDEYDITVRLEGADRASLESLRAYTVVHEGKQIPLVSVADFHVGSGFGSITHKDLDRVVTVRANAREGVNAQALLFQVQAHLKPLLDTLPPGYTVKYTGESEDQQESFAYLGKALTIGCALITMVLIFQFNSILLPFIIMLAVGFSLIGVFLGLIVTRTPFGLFTFIGVISLAGVVVNNNIVLIDYMNQLRARGRSKRLAIVEAGATRLRPVILTALTTVIGLVPLTVGINTDFVGLVTDLNFDFRIGSANTQFWGPMGITIIAGLTFATFLTLIIVPVMYSVFDSLSLWLRTKFGLVDANPED
jgi:multidrug efflux pump